MKTTSKFFSFRKLLPKRLRQRLRYLHQQLIFKRAIRQFRENPRCHLNLPSKVLRDLIYGWGNVGFGAEDEYLSYCVRCVLESRHPTLECGSGLSTVLVAVAAEQTGNRHIALESHPEWANRVRGKLKALGLGSLVEVAHAPIKSYGEYDWYDLSVVRLPDEIDCVICDGPPGSTPGGRFGLVPLLKPRLLPGALILLDDASRPKEIETALRWSDEYGLSFVSRGSDKPFFVCRMPTIRA